MPKELNFGDPRQNSNFYSLPSHDASRHGAPRGNAPTRSAVGSWARQEVSVLICPSKVPAGVAGLAATTTDAAGAPDGVFDAKMDFLIFSAM